MTLIPPGATIGIIGGGQLGRMLATAASTLGYKTHIFCPEADCPASHVATTSTIAAYTDNDALFSFAKAVDVITFEFENIPYTSVQILEQHSIVRPGWNALHISQNRLREKNFVTHLGIATAHFRAISSLKDLKEALTVFGVPCILKTCELGYDGKGQFVITADTDITSLANEIALDNSPSESWILEAFVRYTKEISVIVSRNPEGKILCYCPVENRHVGGILDTTIAPAVLEAQIAETAQTYACKLAEALNLTGLLAVEFFVTKEGELLVNEIAPRPHNSGHWSIDACITSQFEQCIRAICGLPFGSVTPHSRAVMKNLIGDAINDWPLYLEAPETKFHHYGKHDIKPGRKMGHITILQPIN